MIERPYDWQADVKSGGDTISIVFRDGEWTATGGEMAHMVLVMFEINLDRNIDAMTVNPVITGQMGDLFEKSLRTIPGVTVYGIDAAYLDIPDDEVSARDPI
jgi:hypothetical protein